MSLRIGDTAPNFTAETTQGRIDFHEWIGNGYAILFSHPKDFTPVCTTELGYMARLKPEFEARNTKIIGLSVDPVDDHKRWSKDIEETQGAAVYYPMIGDADMKVAKVDLTAHGQASEHASIPDHASAMAKMDRPERPAMPERPSMPERPQLPDHPTHVGRPGG